MHGHPPPQANHPGYAGYSAYSSPLSAYGAHGLSPQHAPPPPAFSGGAASYGHPPAPPRQVSRPRQTQSKHKYVSHGSASHKEKQGSRGDPKKGNGRRDGKRVNVGSKGQHKDLSSVDGSSKPPKGDRQLRSQPDNKMAPPLSAARPAQPKTVMDAKSRLEEWL
eukprot:gnl/MRDRNA2_/MRDRNA2_84909_c0_seq3.p1 gnl/MRDRNA2_/MRDRNA2_84909_c0~~gnl/MRDRNA2_/MRDRNA2_84909_c0_seq3.p1  ORF type:complete len:164 (+),score=31.91 gnl/MRDRNA2_/MRDRNA2_84909_c0_seq3:398-889(+)